MGGLMGRLRRGAARIANGLRSRAAGSSGFNLLSRAARASRSASRSGGGRSS